MGRLKVVKLKRVKLKTGSCGAVSAMSRQSAPRPFFCFGKLYVHVQHLFKNRRGVQSGCVVRYPLRSDAVPQRQAAYTYPWPTTHGLTRVDTS